MGPFFPGASSALIRWGFAVHRPSPLHGLFRATSTFYQNPRRSRPAVLTDRDGKHEHIQALRSREMSTLRDTADTADKDPMEDSCYDPREEVLAEIETHQEAEAVPDTPEDTAPAEQHERSCVGEDTRDLTPEDMVRCLDGAIIGQTDAKRAVANAIRNRWRRQRLTDAYMRDEIMPRNILMIGPTGCGKTEIARRLSKIIDAPFIKGEVTKFTEVGFHGRDVDSIIKDLVQLEVKRQQAKLTESIRQQASEQSCVAIANAIALRGPYQNVDEDTLQDFVDLVRRGDWDDHEVTVELTTNPWLSSGPSQHRTSTTGAAQVATADDKPPSTTAARGKRGAASGDGSSAKGAEEREGKKKHSKAGNGHENEATGVRGSRSSESLHTLRVKDARAKLTKMEVERQLSLQQDTVCEKAVKAVEDEGIVFLDEIDKICSKASDYKGPDASAEGVQRDLLPLLEGTTISTQYGNVKTDYILFIAAGAFLSVKPSDLLAEMQGRLPVRVQLTPLNQEDFQRILTEPDANLLKQQQALLATEGIHVEFQDGAVHEIARVATEMNYHVENIGARRLYTIIEKLMEDISYKAPSMPKDSKLIVDACRVRSSVVDFLQRTDLHKYIL
uniref:AAA+ ATPase domain-containing protein n=1 Tax=Vitrella brassicaformis TaxID=1169539 RepID=A0A7S1KFG1_9ALVE|mmetsp:Transcript_49525/g.124206  ORF Transcript_49525/g.124206 Transcript_49525/m.124206 type:complete len:616 (+) Transcript_49525:85-1932(+)